MRVLVAYDGSACADAATVDLRRAGMPKDTEVLVLCVVDAGRPPASGSDFPAEASHPPSKTDLDEGRALANTACKWIRSNFPDWEVTTQVLWGPPASVILEKARSWHPDLLIVGSHGRSLAGRILLGSVSQKVLQEAPCSVRVVRAGVQSDSEPIRIVVGSDGSTEAEGVIQEVRRRSWPNGTEVRIVSVVETIVPVVSALEANVYAAVPALAVIQDSDDRHRARIGAASQGSHASLHGTGLIVTEVVVEGDPKRELVADAVRWNADAIFVGARGLGRLEKVLLGSVSSSVFKHAHCAVEVVRRNPGTEKESDSSAPSS